MSFTELVDLASDRLGGAVLWASDEFFAEKDSLLKATKAVWKEDEYTDRGKWMDGWESRRRYGRREGHDFCLIRLGAPGILHGVVVDTAFFRGNYPESFSLEGVDVSGHPSPDDLLDPKLSWTKILEKVPLRGDSENPFPVETPWRFTHLRFHIHPDGGVARLRVHGEAVPDWRRHGGLEGEVDLASAECGARVVACTDMFFGSRHNLIYPSSPSGMHDGWETRRRRTPGHDHAVLKLGARGSIARIVIDTTHFKGNSPDRFSLEGGPGAGGPWVEIYPETKLQPHTRHVFFEGLRNASAFSHVRLHIYPDGGVSRLRLYGKLSPEGRAEQRLLQVNTLLPHLAERALLACCGAKTWANAVASMRPFADLAALESASEAVFSRLKDADWLEAFRAHPRIGQSAQTGSETHKRWSSSEQGQVGSAGDRVKAELAELNRQYEEKFGHIYIVLATGKSAEEMVAICKSRLENDPQEELQVAAEEQKKITRLRLKKLVEGA
jgi:allantoicase